MRDDSILVGSGLLHHFGLGSNSFFLMTHFTGWTLTQTTELMNVFIAIHVSLCSRWPLRVIGGATAWPVTSQWRCAALSRCSVPVPPMGRSTNVWWSSWTALQPSAPSLYPRCLPLRPRIPFSRCTKLPVLKSVVGVVLVMMLNIKRRLIQRLWRQAWQELPGELRGCFPMYKFCNLAELTYFRLICLRL